jgi:hypothetical protein
MLGDMATAQAVAHRDVQSAPPEHYEGAEMGSSDVLSSAPATPSSGGRMIDRARAVSTPTVLWLAQSSLVVALLVLGAVAIRVVTDRLAAIETVRSEGAPLVTNTESLYVALADADAAASTAFLEAGLEPEALRARYDSDIVTAGHQLAVLGRSAVLPNDAIQSLITLNQRLPAYTAFIESARVNNRLGYPLGAAYQRRASDVMQQELLPAATSLYKSSARHLDGGRWSGSQRGVELAVIVAGVVVIALLVAVHLFLTSRTRRLLNGGLIGGALIVLAMCTATFLGLQAQRHALTESQHEGSDPLIVLSTARILALRSMSDENLDLIERGTNAVNMAHFASDTASVVGVDGHSGLLDRAVGRATDVETAARVAAIRALHDRFLAVHAQVQELAGADDYRSAIGVATTDEARASAALDAAFGRELEQSRSRLAERANDAARDLRLLPYVIFLAVLVAAAAVAAGMWPRIREYR